MLALTKQTLPKHLLYELQSELNISKMCSAHSTRLSRISCKKISFFTKIEGRRIGDMIKGEQLKKSCLVIQSKHVGQRCTNKKMNEKRGFVWEPP